VRVLTQGGTTRGCQGVSSVCCVTGWVGKGLQHNT
jgi:hypothetical protein